MYDHKFRHNDRSFGRPPRRSRRALVWVGGALALGVLIYTALQFNVPGGIEQQRPSGSRSDVIPLTLPPPPAASAVPEER